MKDTMTRRCAIALTSVGIVLLCALVARPLVAQRSRNIDDGVFTDVQAERGREVYANFCVRCHLLDMSGSAGPPLKGEAFFTRWESDTLDGLFTKVRDSMPPRIGNADLTDEQKIDVTAYLLSANGFPSGDEELVMDADFLASVAIARNESRGTVRNFALVHVVGCVAPGSGSSWMLARPSEPIIATPTVDVVDSAGVTSTSSGDSYLLISGDRLDTARHNGAKVLVKGLIYRTPGQRLLTIASIHPLAPTCEG